MARMLVTGGPGWRAKRGIENMCRDARRRQAENPDGYAG
jgi:hypothetical protein